MEIDTHTNVRSRGSRNESRRVGGMWNEVVLLRRRKWVETRFQQNQITFCPCKFRGKCHDDCQGNSKTHTSGYYIHKLHNWLSLSERTAESGIASPRHFDRAALYPRDRLRRERQERKKKTGGTTDKERFSRSARVHARVRPLAELFPDELLERGRVPPVLEVVLGPAPLEVAVGYLDPALSDLGLALPELHVLFEMRETGMRGRRRKEVVG